MPARNFEDPERRPRLVSARAADRFALLTSAAKPASPFDEDPALLATLANATCLTLAGDLNRIFLRAKGTTSESDSSANDEDGEGLAFRLAFPLTSGRDISDLEKTDDR